MSDNNRSYGYRANTPYDRTQGSAAAPRTPGDPLAELARLIGQQNESEPVHRQNVAGPSEYTQGKSGGGWSQPSPDAYGRHEPDARLDSYSRYDDPSETGHGGGSQDSHYADRRYAHPQQYPSQSYGDPSPGAASQGAASYGQSYSDQSYQEPQAFDPRYGDPRYGDPQYAHTPQGYGANGYPEPQGYASPQYAPSYGGQSYDDPQTYGGSQAYGAQPGYPQDPSGYGNMPGFAAPTSQSGFDSFYNNASPANMHMPVGADHAPARRRGSIVTVLAVLALAVVGTAAAFGYRAMFGTGGTPVPPPVIRADPRPNKVMPVANDPNAKPIQDRVGGEGERVVSREEAPVDPSRASNPRVIFPNLSEQGQKPSGPSVAANVGPTGSAGPAEPKKIRTVAIKPDSSQAPAARNAQASADNAPLPLSPNAQQAAPAPSSRHSAPQPQAPQQHASRTSTSGSSSAFPAPIGSPGSAAIPSVAAGAYAVQVTSQRTEADAQASYKSLQGQFPTVLGSRQPVIKKAELGDKGTYYRAQIPFASQNEASEFCSSLKAAGGQCVVQKN